MRLIRSLRRRRRVAMARTVRPCALAVLRLHQLKGEHADAGHVAAWPRETGEEVGRDRVRRERRSGSLRLRFSPPALARAPKCKVSRGKSLVPRVERMERVLTQSTTGDAAAA